MGALTGVVILNMHAYQHCLVHVIWQNSCAPALALDMRTLTKLLELLRSQHAVSFAKLTARMFAARPPEPLPENLQRICDVSEQTVFVSFGSTATPEPELLASVHHAVSSVDASVVWKVRL